MSMENPNQVQPQAPILNFQQDQPQGPQPQPQPQSQAQPQPQMQPQPQQQPQEQQVQEQEQQSPSFTIDDINELLARAYSLPTQQQQTQPIFNIEFDEEAVNEALNNPKKFKEVISTVYKKAVEDVINTINMELPKVFLKYTADAFPAMHMAQSFFDRNPHLEPYAPLVTSVAIKIRQSNPNLSIREVFNRVEKEVNELIAKTSQMAKVIDNTDKGNPQKVVQSTPQPTKANDIKSFVQQLAEQRLDFSDILR